MCNVSFALNNKLIKILSDIISDPLLEKKIGFSSTPPPFCFWSETQPIPEQKIIVQIKPLSLPFSLVVWRLSPPFTFFGQDDGDPAREEWGLMESCSKDRCETPAPTFERKSGVDRELHIFSTTFFAMTHEGRGGPRERRFRGHQETTNPCHKPHKGQGLQTGLQLSVVAKPKGQVCDGKLDGHLISVLPLPALQYSASWHSCKPGLKERFRLVSQLQAL